MASPIAPAAREFILARQTTLRGIDLDRFDFDYDLTWMAFFLDADGRVLGRYGGRGPESAEGRSSLAGLRRAMLAALARHRAGVAEPAPANGRVRTIADYPASKRLSARACAHCHYAYDYRREARQQAGEWTKDELWVYPLPENLGLVMGRDREEVVQEVAPGSSAARAGLKAGDVIVRAGGRPVASFAELQYALHRAPAAGVLEVRFARGGREQAAELKLEAGWRKTDVSWRWSLRGVGPAPGVRGSDLSVKEKRALGLTPSRLAYQQGAFVSREARQDGLRPGDVVVGVAGRMLRMTGRQFVAHVRLNYKAGDRVTYNLLRDGRPADVTLTLR